MLTYESNDFKIRYTPPYKLEWLMHSPKVAIPGDAMVFSKSLIASDHMALPFTNNSLDDVHSLLIWHDDRNTRPSSAYLALNLPLLNSGENEFFAFISVSVCLFTRNVHINIIDTFKSSDENDCEMYKVSIGDMNWVIHDPYKIPRYGA